MIRCSPWAVSGLRLVRIVTALVALAFLANGTMAMDPCALLAASIRRSGGYAVNSQYAACLKSFPYNAVNGKATVDTLLKALSFYPYLDLAIKNPDPRLPGAVDLRKGLAAIQAAPWSRELEFHSALFALFNSLNDGHTLYESSCFQYFPVASAFLFSKYYVASRGKEVVYLAPSIGSIGDIINLATEKLLKLKLRDYANAEVLTIEGNDPLTYITSWADMNGGTYRDLNARVNAAFSRPVYDSGGLNFNPGDFSARPLPQAKDYFQITIRRSGSRVAETINVPWIVDMSFAQTFVNSSEFKSIYCSNSGSQLGAFKLGKRKPKPKMMVPKRRWKQTKVMKVQALKSAPGQPTTLLDAFLKVFLLPDKVTAVLVVPDFDGSRSASWTLQLESAIAVLKNSKAKRLILDLSNNPGGDVELAHKLLQTLFPSIFFNYPMELAAPPLAQAMATRNQQIGDMYSNYYYGIYADVSGAKYTSASQFFFPVKNTIRNGHSSSFSKRLTLVLPRPTPGKLPLFSAKDLVVLTNGNCASSCATVTYNLFERLGVKHVVTGGILNKPMAFSGLMVGYVTDLQTLLDSDIIALGFGKDVRAPKPFTYQSVQSLSFPFVQSFCLHNSTVPGDFVFLPAQVHLPYTSVTAWNFPKLWQQVATYF